MSEQGGSTPFSDGGHFTARSLPPPTVQQAFQPLPWTASAVPYPARRKRSRGLVLLLVAVSPVIMPSQITGNVADYGLVGAAFVLSLWAVTYSTIVVFGTLLGQVYVSRGRSLGRRNR